MSSRLHITRRLLTLVLSVLFTFPAGAEEAKFSDAVKASLLFRAEHDPAAHYPHVLKVFLRLDNVVAGDVTWVANSATDIRAELLDADGRPVIMPPSAASIGSNSRLFLLPYGSSMDWLISGGGISMMGDLKNMYAIVVGGRGWLVPVDSIGSYTLQIQLHGRPWLRRVEDLERGELPLILELPATKIEITK